MQDQRKAEGWGNWGEEVSPAESGLSATTQLNEKDEHNQVTSKGKLTVMYQGNL